MASPLFETTEALHQLAGSIRAVQGVEMNRFSRAIEAIEQIAKGIDGPLAIVGGLAAIHHRALVTTLDIDIVAPRNKLDVLLVEAERRGFVVKKRSPNGWHRFAFQDEEGDVDIDVIPEGGRTPRDPDYAPPIPGPDELGLRRGVGYASFPGWVAMKLVANRDKDRYHLVEVLKQASQEEIGEAVVKVRQMNPVYLSELERLLSAAEDEKQEDW